MRPWAFTALLGACWGAFSLWLFLNGHAPSGPTPLPRALHYLIQAALLPPLMLMAVFAGATVAQRLLPDSDRRSIAYAFAGGTGVFWLLPDVIAYVAFGFEALAALAPWLGALSAVASLIASTLMLREITTLPRAFGTSTLAYLAFAFVLTTLLR